MVFIFLMVQRTYWIDLVKSAWGRKPIIWLSGVRGTGKTCLCQSLSDVEYFHCALPDTRRKLQDAEEFVRNRNGQCVALDEIHHLPNSSEILKAAVQASVRVIATGSPSFLGNLPPENLTEVRLTPMVSRDLVDFENQEMSKRFLRGGLPSFFLKPQRTDLDFQEWLDLFWAHDIQDWFGIAGRASFQNFAALLFRETGELFEASRFPSLCGVSRPTITKYLSVLEAAQAVYVLRPFSTRRPVEIVSAPKVYAFDTGFFCYARCWKELREEDFQVLWKQLVLNEMYSRVQSPDIHYWRDKRGHEVDFVWVHRVPGIVAIAAQWRAHDFEPYNLRAFRYHYPNGPNWVVCRDVGQGYIRPSGKLNLDFMNLEEMNRRLSEIIGAAREKEKA